MTGVLNAVGWVQDVIVNRQTQHVIDGHLRVSLAISRNEPTVPVVYVDLDEGEERMVLATLDPLGSMAAMDAEQLQGLLADIVTDDRGLSALLADLQQESHDRVFARGSTPALDHLSAGEITPSDFWPVLRFQVPPDLHARMTQWLAAAPGKTDSDKLGTLLDRAGG